MNIMAIVQIPNPLIAARSLPVQSQLKSSVEDIASFPLLRYTDNDISSNIALHSRSSTMLDDNPHALSTPDMMNIDLLLSLFILWDAQAGQQSHVHPG